MNLPPKVTERAFERLSEIGAADQGQAQQKITPTQHWASPERG